MPRKTRSTTVYFKDEAEREGVEAKARSLSLSESNYFRSLAGLEPLKHGGKDRKPDDQVKPSALYQRARRERLKAKS